MKGLITISLKGLRFFAYHGYHEEESIVGNSFEVEVAITYKAESIISSIHQTINYVQVYEQVKAVMSQPQKLLETVAMLLAENLHKEFRSIQKVVISITKLTAPISNFTGSVGVSYTKEY